jgi:vacuolar-type H+-ATPase subunit F/Vma7
VSRAAAIGDDRRLAGYALAGAIVIAARGDDELARAIDDLPADVALVILSCEPTGAALAALAHRTGTVWCSLPT